MSRIVIFLLRQFLSYLLSILLIIQPVMSYALDGIAVDTSSSGSRANLDSAQNGVPIVNIVNPNSSGLSHNKFIDFNVDKSGVIINNSRTLGVSKLGGAINGNANLSSEARLILNEVTSSNRSALNGATEIFGGKAEYILANPSGITCNGCGFINTPRVTLSTGTPTLQDGGLFGFDVEGGDVVFEGTGFNGKDGDLSLDAFDIISRTAQIATELHVTGDLNVISGTNEVNYSDLSTIKKASSDSPEVSIDSSALGGMYAGKIKLVATEEGVGVKSDGDLVTDAGDMIITADGKLTYKNIVSKQDVHITAGSVEQTANSYAANDLNITATDGDIALAGDLAAAGNDVNLTSDANITLDDMQLQSGLEVITDTDGSISYSTAEGNITLDANTAISNLGGNIISNGALRIGLTKIPDIFTNSGFISSIDEINITAGSINNNTTYLVVDGQYSKGIHGLSDINLTASTGDIYNNSGAVTTTGTLNLSARHTLDNSEAIIDVANVIITANALNNAFGYINSSSSDDKSIITTAGAIDNNNGRLLAAGDMEVSMHLGDNSSGVISSLKTLVITAIDRLTNSGGDIYAEDSLSLSNVDNNSGNIQAGNIISIDNTDIGNFDNNLGHVLSFKTNSVVVINVATLGTAAVSIQNYDLEEDAYQINGDITTGGYFALTADSLINNATINAAEYISIILTAGDFTNNSDGKLISGESIDIDLTDAGNIINYGELSAPDIDIDIADGNLTNYASGIISSSDATSTLTINVLDGYVTNNGRISGSGDLELSTVTFNNMGGQIISDSDLTVTTSGNSIYNEDGAMIYATNDLNLYSDTVENSGGSHIYSLEGDILIEKNTGGDSSSSVSNSSSTIEALEGDITINAVSIINTREDLDTVTVDFYPDNLDMTLGHSNAKSAWLWNTARSGDVSDTNCLASVNECYSYIPRGGDAFNAFVFRIRGTYSDDSGGFITADNDILISGDSLLNEGGIISSNRDVIINSGSIINEAHIVQE